MAKKTKHFSEMRKEPVKIFKVGILIAGSNLTEYIVVTAHRLSVCDGVLYFELDENGESEDIAVFKDWIHVVLTNEKPCKDVKIPQAWGNID